MEYCSHYHHGLPDIIMYGGDTTPWTITLEDENGRIFEPDEGASYTCTFTLSHYGMSAGLGAHTVPIVPILIKTADFRQRNSGAYEAQIKLSIEDTINLRGKFIYQIEVVGTMETRVNQGRLTIIENLYRKAGM